MNGPDPTMKSLAVLGVAVATALAPAALAQPATDATDPQGRPRQSVVIDDPESPAMRIYAQQQKRRIETEKELKKLRHKHFGSMAVGEIRQAGIARLREYTDPAIYQA